MAVVVALRPNVLGRYHRRRVYRLYQCRRATEQTYLRSLTDIQSRLAKRFGGGIPYLRCSMKWRKDTGKVEKILSGKIVLNNLSVHFWDGKQALNNVNLVVNPGETVALIGRSGAGKTI